jgi:circadian clock protein KaiB
MSSEGHIQIEQQAHYVLRLYITGTTPRSAMAIVNTRKFLEKYVKGRYDLKVIDILKEPAAAAREQIIAAPTLVKEAPMPLRRFIGDMSQFDRILRGLDLRTAQ